MTDVFSLVDPIVLGWFAVAAIGLSFGVWKSMRLRRADFLQDPAEIASVLDSVLGVHKESLRANWPGAMIFTLILGVLMPLGICGGLSRTTAGIPRVFVAVVGAAWAVIVAVAEAVMLLQSLAVTSSAVERTGPFPWRVPRSAIAGIRVRLARGRRTGVLVILSVTGQRYEFPLVGGLGRLIPAKPN